MVKFIIAMVVLPVLIIALAFFLAAKLKEGK